MERKSAKEIATATIDSLNSFGFDNKAYAEVVTATHPTLQQSWMRMAMTTIRELAKKADVGYYDGRNEDTVLMAKKIMEAIGDDALPFV